MKAPPPLCFEAWLEDHPRRAEQIDRLAQSFTEVVREWLSEVEVPIEEEAPTLVLSPRWSRRLTMQALFSSPEPTPGWECEGEGGRRLVRVFRARSPKLARDWASFLTWWTATFGWSATVSFQGSTVRAELELAGAEVSERDLSRAFTLSLVWIELEREAESVTTDFEEAIGGLLERPEVWPPPVH